MPQKKNLIVFDIDGTLTDTVAIHQQAFREALTLMGIAAFDDNFATYKHHTDFHIAKTIYENIAKTGFDRDTSAQFEAYLHELISQETITEIRGAGKVVAAIENESDYGVCYATGSLFAPAKTKLERVGIRFEPMQLVASNETEEREKIIEKAIENAQEYYNAEKFERIISFGDGLWDLKTADNLSLEFVGIGSANEAILKQNGMKRHYLDFSEIKIAEL